MYSFPDWGVAFVSATTCALVSVASSDVKTLAFSSSLLSTCAVVSWAKTAEKTPVQRIRQTALMIFILLLPVSPDGIPNHPASPVPYRLHVFQVRMNLRPQICHKRARCRLSQFVGIQKTWRVELNGENRIPILIDGLMHEFGSRNLH